MKKYIDFHTHTIYSDGADNPASLVRNSRLKGIDILAITDHDNLAGFEEAKAEADIWNMQIIPGAEISTEIYHILALNVNPKDKEFETFLERVRAYQTEVCQRRIDLLSNNGIPMTLAKLKHHFPKSRLGQLNLHMTMLKDPECNTLLKKRHPTLSPSEIKNFYFRGNGIAAKIGGDSGYVSSKEAIDAIHRAGGIAVLAHPFHEIKEDIPETLDGLMNEGLDAIEVQPFYGEKNKPFIKYATQREIPMTYGSDFHGAYSPRPLMGRHEMGNHLEEAQLETLLNKWK